MPCLLPTSATALLAASLALPAFAADPVACTVTYGGESRRFTAGPTDSPYRVPAAAIGSYFLFRLVVEAEVAKIYVYADHNAGPALIHQAAHPYPPGTAIPSPYGFTGLNFVYEPLRDGELQYWCAYRPAAKEAA